MSEGFLPVGAPVDLTNCEREPIHIPGSVQPHGALVALASAEAPVHQASTTAAAAFGLPLEHVLGAHLPSLFDPPSVAAVRESMRDPGAVATPFQVVSRNGVVHDALVHHSGGAWVVELEPHDPRTDDVGLANTYHSVRAAVAELNRCPDVDALHEAAVRHIRAITGFDRVMLYRFDRDWNGEVRAEAKRDDLESFRGLHYPASDIPAQARALYTVNWLRFIRDVDAANAPLEPQHGLDGQPLDLSFAALRSVSPIHCEYLRNMGVTASMSVSLVVGGQLTGLIACHHYSGPYVPAAPVRATCEFLAQTLSLLLAGKENEQATQRSREASAALQRVVLATVDREVRVADALEAASDSLLALVAADGAVWTLDGTVRTAGVVPDADLGRLVGWASATLPAEGFLVLDALRTAEPSLADLAATASGVLALRIGEDQLVLFLRQEAEGTVDWGGNPHLKQLVVGSDGAPRLSPRGSFALWRETVTGRAEPWDAAEVDSALALRRHLVQELYDRSRAMVGVAVTLQRSLLPEVLPQPAGWAVAAHYQPASVAVGGDWYDVFDVSQGVVLVVGDVAGHGLAAAGTMAQLRNALRAYAVEEPEPGRVVRRLDHLASLIWEDAMATAAIVHVVGDVATVCCAGHPVPILRRADGTAAPLALRTAPPLGAGWLARDQQPESVTVRLAPGDALLLCSDGAFERRGDSIDVCFQRWVDAVAATDVAGDLQAVVTDLAHRSRPPEGDDDTTVLAAVRLG